MNELQGVPQLGLEIVNAILQDPHILALFAPMFLLLEVPLSLCVLFGVFQWRTQYKARGPLRIAPHVSCIITCYAEGDAIEKTVRTLFEQTYPGQVDIIVVVDGAVQNKATFEAAKRAAEVYTGHPLRRVIVLPKWQRGGRVSTLNAGLAYARGEIVMNADGDTSFDSDMLVEIVKEFEDPAVPAVGGALRVRNADTNILTQMQAIEYLTSIQGSKTGLAQWNLINNISGAFGAFRRSFLVQIGGWNTHTAEDLDLTLRIKQYLGRHPELRIPFAARAIGHTDVPDTARDLFFQRLRWDGDLAFVYLRKHRFGLSPTLLGLKTFVYTMVYGVAQNVLIPLVVVGFTLWMAVVYPWQAVAAVALLLYTYYYFHTLFKMGLFIGLVSERRADDYRRMVWAVLFPAYTLTLRFVMAFSIINELVRRGHEESTMAPWWVLKRGQRF